MSSWQRDRHGLSVTSSMLGKSGGFYGLFLPTIDIRKWKSQKQGWA